MVVKNRSTPKDAAFWAHVDTISAQAREQRRQQVNEKPKPEHVIPDEEIHQCIQQQVSNEKAVAKIPELSVESVEQLMGRIAALTAEVDALKAELARLSAPVTVDDVSLLAIMLTAMHEGVQAPSRAEIAAAMNALILARATPLNKT